MNDSNLEGASEKAKQYSKVSDLGELRAQFKPDYSASASAAGGSHHRAVYSTLAMKSAGPGHERAVAPMMDLMAAPGGATAAAAGEETYGVSNSEIDYTQSERLVQKALKRDKK